MNETVKITYNMLHVQIDEISTLECDRIYVHTNIRMRTKNVHCISPHFCSYPNTTGTTHPSCPVSNPLYIRMNIRIC